MWFNEGVSTDGMAAEAEKLTTRAAELTFGGTLAGCSPWTFKSPEPLINLMNAEGDDRDDSDLVPFRTAVYAGVDDGDTWISG